MSPFVSLSVSLSVSLIHITLYDFLNNKFENFQCAFSFILGIGLGLGRVIGYVLA